MNKITYFYIIIIVLTILDGTLTITGLNLGFSEANPFVNMTAAQLTYPLAIVLFMGVNFLGLMLIELERSKHDPKLDLFISILLAWVILVKGYAVGSWIYLLS